MTSKRKLILLGTVLCLLLGVLFIAVAPNLRLPRLVSRTDPPKIRFEEELHELGSVQEGIEIPYTFKIHNVGGEPLKIKKVSTTCGCTLLKLKDSSILPGKSGDLEVVMDTTMKQGYVKKAIDVISNDPKTPQKTIYLGAMVLAGGTPKVLDLTKPGGKSTAMVIPPQDVVTIANPHEGLTEMNRAKIFTGNCAVCHVQQGKGKLGESLYLADCAMCHGQKAEGKVGPSLVMRDYQDKAVAEHMEQIIRNGSPRHKSMPGFSLASGGPLTDEEITSLMEFLERRSEEIKHAYVADPQ